MKKVTETPDTRPARDHGVTGDGFRESRPGDGFELPDNVVYVPKRKNIESCVDLAPTACCSRQLESSDKGFPSLLLPEVQDGACLGGQARSSLLERQPIFCFPAALSRSKALALSAHIVSRMYRQTFCDEPGRRYDCPMCRRNRVLTEKGTAAFPEDFTAELSDSGA